MSNLPPAGSFSLLGSSRVEELQEYNSNKRGFTENEWVDFFHYFFPPKRCYFSVNARRNKWRCQDFLPATLYRGGIWTHVRGVAPDWDLWRMLYRVSSSAAAWKSRFCSLILNHDFQASMFSSFRCGIQISFVGIRTEKILNEWMNERRMNAKV